MAVSILGFSVVVRNQTLEGRFPGGPSGYKDLCPNRTFCTDGVLSRVAFMTLPDAELFVDALARRGLNPGEKGICVEVALFSNSDKPVFPCPWLEPGMLQGRPAAWLAGGEPGELSIPEVELKSAGLKEISLEELRDCFERVDTGNSVEKYRDRRSGKVMYIGRTSPQIPHERKEITPEEIAEHNRTYQKAAQLVKNELPLHERQYMGKPRWWTRRKLYRALTLFDRVLALNPGNWSAMWVVGMVYKRVGDYSTALSWFDRAYDVNPYESSIVREACSAALEIEKHEQAIHFARRAVQIDPSDYGLQANLALAYLLAGRLAEAKAAIDQAIAGDPSDRISMALRAGIEHFTRSGERPPTTPLALENYRRQRRVPW